MSTTTEANTATNLKSQEGHHYKEGTPCFFINGKRYDGPLALESLLAAVSQPATITRNDKSKHKIHIHV
jgi:protein-disulfide isomerase